MYFVNLHITDVFILYKNGNKTNILENLCYMQHSVSFNIMSGSLINTDYEKDTDTLLCLKNRQILIDINVEGIARVGLRCSRDR